ALRRFAGAARRHARHHLPGGIEIVDDYAHHPTEIQAVLQTARLGSPRRVIVVFQPHRYSRTARLLDRFGEVLGQADALLLTEVYAASESRLEGVDAAAVARAVRRHSGIPVEIAASLEDAASRVRAMVAAGDLVAVRGAGSIARLAPRLVELLQGRGA
ncbi:MAG: UDP-N-acetylmuramate--L-alanine ligase, partial [Chloroflexi bacterium]|nr:UDP-N-acetylmuramate--L-alanine ligase [Chloroflexota bacterium]